MSITQDASTETLTFTDVLRIEVAAMQAKYPERVGEIGRAHALIVSGYVKDLGEGAGAVLSSNTHTWYTVTQAACTCEAGSHGTPCKHLSAWRLYRFAARSWTTRTRPPCPLDVAMGDPAPGPAVCPEASFSLTLRGSMDGMDAQLTVRGATAETFKANVEAIRALLVPPPVQVLAPGGQDEPTMPPPEGQMVVAPAEAQRFCPRHGDKMTHNHKDGQSWWSHRLPDKSWCKGK
jgi:hypothetical protein